MRGGTRPGRADAPDVRRARLAIAAVFAVHGSVTGSFATRVPWIQEHAGINAGQLGLALAFPAVGASVSMPLAGRISHRFGARTALRGLLALWCGSLALPPLAPGLVTLCGALFVYGATSGMADVAMNALGVEVERQIGRSIMSGLHGVWSIGTLLGSGVGTLAAHAGTDARLHFGAVAAALVLLGAVACHWVWDLRSAPEDDPPPRFALPPRAALVIGAVGFCAVFAECASMDWSAVYLRDVMDSSAGAAAACTTAFTCTMAASRLVGDAVVRRIGAVRTVRAGGTCATLGGLLVMAAPGPVPAAVGFGLIGVGIAVVVPLAFAAAGRTGPAAAQSIAGVATITYASGLMAPAAVGSIADVASLTASFGLVTVLALGLVAGAGVLRAPSAGQEDGPAGTSGDAAADAAGRTTGQAAGQAGAGTTAGGGAGQRGGPG